MSQWLIILGAALAGGLLLLHALAQAKAGSERMLDTYGDLLRKARDTRRPEPTEQQAVDQDDPPAEEPTPPE